MVIHIWINKWRVINYLGFKFNSNMSFKWLTDFRNSSNIFAEKSVTELQRWRENKELGCLFLQTEIIGEIYRKPPKKKRREFIPKGGGNWNFKIQVIRMLL